ncbi:MAG: MmgE/PrpD family protein [Chloroflexota bacterium]|nr:MmgE/PrpD family protein [Chloroflexota bacterium]
MDNQAIAPTHPLAAWAASVQPADIPARVRERTSQLLLDTMASAVAGRHGDETAQIESTARALAAGDEATGIGTGRLSRIGAAFLNGYQVTAVTVCDVYRPNLCHVTPEVVPPALAAAEGRGVSGSDLLTAIAVGLEVTTRIGRGIRYASFRARGWHSPGVIGAFGGAASAGRVLGVDGDQMRYAFGLAGAQASGTFAHWGTPTIKFHQAHGSTAGLLAATLAHAQFRASEEVLTHEDGGIFHAYSDGGDPAAVIADLGRAWELERISMRLWPAASSIQAVVSAVFDLIEAHDVTPDDVARMTISLSETTYRMHGEMGWDDRFRALLSTRYAAAVVLHDRACWLDQFRPQRIADAAVHSFAANRIDVLVDETLPVTGAAVQLGLTDGRQVTVRRDVPKGDADDPLTIDEIVAKFRLATAGTLSEDAAERALELLLNIEAVADIDDLMRHLSMPFSAGVGQ